MTPTTETTSRSGANRSTKRTARVSITMPPALAERLRAAAAERGASLADVVRDIVGRELLGVHTAPRYSRGMTDDR